MPATVRGYTRVSTTRQAEDGFGLDAQRAAIQAEADRRGWGEVAWYVETGESGKDMARPQMTRLLADIRRGDTLIAAKVDRLSRSLADFGALMERAQAERWNLVALDMALDLSSANGEFVASLLAAVARLERRLIGERTAAGMAAAKLRGQLPGRRSQLPRAVQDQLVELRNAGLTLQHVADAMNTRGLPTSTGTRWSTSTVHASIRSATLETHARATVAAHAL